MAIPIKIDEHLKNRNCGPTIYGLQQYKFMRHTGEEDETRVAPRFYVTPREDRRSRGPSSWIDVVNATSRGRLRHVKPVPKPRQDGSTIWRRCEEDRRLPELVDPGGVRSSVDLATLRGSKWFLVFSKLLSDEAKVNRCEAVLGMIKLPKNYEILRPSQSAVFDSNTCKYPVDRPIIMRFPGIGMLIG